MSTFHERPLFPYFSDTLYRSSLFVFPTDADSLEGLELSSSAPGVLPIRKGHSLTDIVQGDSWLSPVPELPLWIHALLSDPGGDLYTRHIVCRSAAFRRIKTVGFHSRFPESYPMTTTIHPPATRLPTPETAFSLCAGISGNGGQGAWYSIQQKCQHTWQWRAGFSGLNHTACILAPPGFRLPSQGLPSGVTIDLLAKL